MRVLEYKLAGQIIYMDLFFKMTGAVKAEASINVHDFMAAQISVSETAYLLTLFKQCCKRWLT
jgi:hypothetical protein